MCKTDVGVSGTCLWTGSHCDNSYVVGKCPGGNDVMCCPSGSGNGTTGNSSSTSSITKSATSGPSSQTTATTTSNPAATSPIVAHAPKDLSTGGIIGVTIAGLIGAAALAALIVWMVMRRRSGPDSPTPAFRSFSGPVFWRGPELEGSSNSPQSTISPLTPSTQVENTPPMYIIQELHGDAVQEMRGHKE
jgi:hypothetical protein